MMLLRKYQVAVLIAPVIVTLLACWPVHSALTMTEKLRESWLAYKARFIQSDGRVIDLKAEGVSTSEGQSYALLRAVWIDDQATFARILEWADNNLNRNVRSDALFAWRWGKREDNSWGVLDVATASDADIDTAYALLLAADRWGNRQYHDRALVMLNNIWNQETVEVAGKRYLIAGDQALDANSARLNPSYFAPYAYRLFARRDRAHNWQAMIAPGYEMLEQTSKASRVGLPPNWAQLDLKTGAITVADSLTSRDGDYSYDAIRVFWRVSLDYRLYREARARDYLERHTNWLQRYWSIRKQLPAELSNEGIPRADYEALEHYAALLPALEIVRPELAQEIFQTKVEGNYQQGLWARPQTDDAYKYYAQNIVWFGLASYREMLPLRVNP